MSRSTATHGRAARATSIPDRGNVRELRVRSSRYDISRQYKTAFFIIHRLSRTETARNLDPDCISPRPASG